MYWEQFRWLSKQGTLSRTHVEGIGGPVVLFEHHSKSDVVDQLENAIVALDTP